MARPRPQQADIRKWARGSSERAMGGRDDGDGGELTRDEFEASVRCLQDVWDAKTDLQRQLGDERRKNEKLRDQISKATAKRSEQDDELRDTRRELEKAKQDAETQRQRAERLDGQLEEARREASEEARNSRSCRELEEQLAQLRRENTRCAHRISSPKHLGLGLC